MKIICLAFSLVLSASGAFAATCTDIAKIMGDPCTPPPGKDADDAKKAILDLLDKAEALEADLVEARTAYLKVRRKADLEKQHKAAEAYHDKKKAQDRLYEEAIQRTRLFYNVQRPNNGYPVTIGKPADPAVDYITGLEVAWNPKPAEYNPDGMLGIKIRGADGLDHYSGVVREAEDGTQKLAITLENGKVLIFKEAFEIARKYKNPGYIGHLLFHEARHFNQLSRGLQDGSAGSRSWASKQEDEAEAYSSDAA